ncbi:MAG TPA: sigma-70 family RNA polymerase sigma factor [Armatimonadota bacterium]|nr:sigma-70 family RNA polymerase sigma factor [Armatimonadota bacterium]HQK95155.1 sigma-70 family RNA polymerase sigma factor [Armatimonadota bacterium]
MSGWRGALTQADADGLFDQAFVEACGKLESQARGDGLVWRRRTPGNTVPLLWRILERRAIDLIIRRREKRIAGALPPGWDEPSGEANPSDEVIDRAVRQRLRDLILGETENRRAFLHLVLIEDWDEAEASRMLGVNENTGRSWYARFLKKCRGALRGWDAP